MDAIGNLLFRGGRALYHYGKDKRYYSAEGLRRRDIPPAALLEGPPPAAYAATHPGAPAYNALRSKHRGLMIQSLLSGVGPARRIPVVELFPPGRERTYLDNAIAAYDALTPAQQYGVNRFLLSTRGIPRVPYRSQAYDDMPSALRQTMRLNLPGTRPYNRLSENAKDIVHKKLRREDELYESIKPILPEDLRRKFHNQVIDFDRRYKYRRQIDGYEIVRLATTANEAVMKIAHNLLVEIKPIPAHKGDPYSQSYTRFSKESDRYSKLRLLYVGDPTDENPFPTVANPNGAEAMRQMVFAMARTWVKVIEEQGRIIERMFRLEKIAEKNLSNHFWHVFIWGKASYSPYMDAAKGYMGKMLSGSGYANEPYIGRQAQPINFLQD